MSSSREDTGSIGPSRTDGEGLCFEVAVAAPLEKSLTYAAPLETDPEVVQTGSRVLVPLGNRVVTGYVLARRPRSDSEDRDQLTLRPIIDLLDAEPLFPASMVELFRWVAAYYHFPLGEVIRTALPAGLSRESGRLLRLTPAGRASDALLLDPRFGKERWLLDLVRQGRLEVQATGRLWKKPAIQRVLRRWEKAGLLVVETVLREDRVRRRLERVLDLPPGLASLVKTDQEPETSLETIRDATAWKLGRAEQTLLLHFLALRATLGGRPVPRRELNRVYRGTSRAAASLIEKGILCEEEVRVYRNPFGEPPPVQERPDCLTEEQKQVLAELIPAAEQGGYRPFLLHGITGSGKTEVYLRLTRTVLRQGKGVLILVPEIALASQIESHFHTRFGEVLAVLHSGLSDGERLDEWQRILAGRARVVIGARSAVFAPLDGIGLIIVDEEHDPAYKQDEGLLYNGRDLAVLRASMHGCPVLLGSATPSVTSYHHARQGRYHLLTMQKRVAGRSLPTVEVVHLGREKRLRPDLFFSDRLIQALQENMEQRCQSLLFVNRRGYASFLLCRDCGHVIRCRHCQVSMTLHRQQGRLVCHYCGYSRDPAILCPGCGAGRLVPLGLGAERVENEVSQVLPHARVARLDSDTATSRKKYLRLLKAVRNREIDVLVGTQMIAKGLHFPHVTLVGVVWADSGLNMPDYKSAERTFSLLAQVTGRAGRGEHEGRVIIQTHQPDHYALQQARRQDYEGFVERELDLRRELGYPPFSRLVNVRFSGVVESQVRKAAARAATFLRERAAHVDVQVLGPAPSPLAQLRDRHRYQVLLKGRSTSGLHQLCSLLLRQRDRMCPGRVMLKLDVDPENMM